MTERELPPRLAQALARDARPVRPLPPAGRALLAVAAVSVLSMAGVALTATFHPGPGRLGPALAWGASGIQVVLGFALVWAALREAIPAAGLPAGPRTALLASAILVHVGTAVAACVRQPAGGGIPFAAGAACARNELLLAAPALLLTAILVLRALPVRPRLAGVLGGAGSALLADAAQHALCPLASLRHLLVWHTGAVLVMAAAGWGLGWAWETWRSRRLFRRRDA